MMVWSTKLKWCVIYAMQGMQLIPLDCQQMDGEVDFSLDRVIGNSLVESGRRWEL